MQRSSPTAASCAVSHFGDWEGNGKRDPRTTAKLRLPKPREQLKEETGGRRSSGTLQAFHAVRFVL